MVKKTSKTKKIKKPEKKAPSSHFVVEEVKEEKVASEPTPDPDPTPAPEPMNTQDFATTPAPPAQQQAAQFPSNAKNTASSPSAQHDFRFSTRPKQKPPWKIIAAVAVVILLIFGLYKLVFSKPKQEEEPPSVTDILVESPNDIDSEPEDQAEEAKEELDRTDYSLQVLNGSGIAGRAGKIAKVFEEAGFEDLDTGNASKYDYQGATIQVKDGQDDLGDLIKADLEDDYEDITIKDNLDEDSEFDAVIIAGLKDDEEEPDDVLGAKDEISESTDKDTEAADSASTGN